MPRQAVVVHRPEPEGVTVSREGSVFVVAGREAARAVAVSDLTNPDALEHVHRRLKRIGVDRALSPRRGPRRRRGPHRGAQLHLRVGALTAVIVVAKIGTSSVTAGDGSVDTHAVGKLCGEVAGLRRDGHTVVVVTSGAVTAGVAAMKPDGRLPDRLR